MSLRHPTRTPRSLTALLALVTVAPSLLLILVGVRMLQQDQILERQHAQIRREQAADLAVVALQQMVAETEGQLRDAAAGPALMTSPDAVLVVIEGDRVSVHPEGQLLYYPWVAAGRGAPDAAFIRVDRLEYRERDYAGAARLAGELARSSDPAVRAAAWVRSARNLARTGDVDGALEALNRAARARDVSIAGVPADLFAAWARCRLLEESGRAGALRKEAVALQQRLLQGHWMLTRAQFELHIADAGAWAGGGLLRELPAARLAFTQAVDRLWARRPGQAARTGSLHGREVLEVRGEPMTVVWVSDGARSAALLARPGFVEARWLRRIAPLLETHGLRARTVHGASGMEQPPAVFRRVSDTGLPWALVVEPEDITAQEARLLARQRIWIAGLLSLVLVAAGGSWVVGRAVTRELAVARLQSDFVAAVSHEFRTPLTTMAQLTESLLEGRATDDRRLAYYVALARQTERLRRLVESLLDFGRMEAGGTPYRRVRFDVAAWVREIVAHFQQDSASRRHAVHLHIGGDVGSVEADREALTSVLWNLLDNAAKYSPDAADLWVDVNADRAGMRVVIDVRDRGPGIPLGEQQDIFQKFVRGAHARAENISGTGLGLAMVRQIVAAHGGDVRVASRPGTGSTFTVSLPAVAGKPGHLLSGAPIAASETCGTTNT